MPGGTLNSDFLFFPLVGFGVGAGSGVGSVAGAGAAARAAALDCWEVAEVARDRDFDFLLFFLLPLINS